MSQSAIARHFNVDNSAISQLFTKYLIPSKEVEIFQKYRAQIYAGKELKSLQALTDKKLKKASATQNAQIARDFHGVHRLETGQSTSNLGLVVDVSPALAAAVKTASAAYLQKMMAGPGDNEADPEETGGAENED